jgi:hypothetical protein
VGGVVVHDQMRLLVWVGAGEVAKEHQELLVPVTWFAESGDLAGGDLQCGEQCGGAVPDVVMSAPRCTRVGVHRSGSAAGASLAAQPARLSMA